MFALTNEVRHYAWGSRTRLAEFRGHPAPSAEPEAELWIGAYPGSPSRLADGRTLLQLIAEDPEAVLGTAGVTRFGPRLPFLMKVLAIGAPLSLQAHPDAAQAQRGFAAEEAAGVPLQDPTRHYRDARHKPELLCALTPVEAFCGFRAVPDTVALLDELAVPELDGLRDALSESGLKAAVAWVTELGGHDVPGAVAALGKSAGTVSDGAHLPALQWISRLSESYSQDRGVVLALLCAYVRLEPGQALSIPAGCLHAYLTGVGVEVMAESDNVLRGGLTSKHVDVVELQRVLTLQDGGPDILNGETDIAGRTRFSTQVEEFALVRHAITEATLLDGHRPSLLLTVEGTARLTARDGTQLGLSRGQAAFVRADEAPVEITGPAVVFEATTALREDSVGD